MAINSKSTKAQILEAYKQLEKEKVQLQKQVEQASSNTESTPVRRRVSSSQNQSPVNPVANNTPNTSMNSSSNVTNIDRVIQSLENLQVGFGSAVSQLSEKLITEATSFSNLQTEIEVETNQLEELHDLEEVENDTLVSLLTTYEESEKNFSQEYDRRKEILQQELEDLSKEWLKEQENHQRQIKLRNDNYAKTKQREEEQYRYDLELERELSSEHYQQELKELYQQLEEAKEDQEKVWEQREKAISDKEQEYAEAKQKVSEFEAKLKAEVKKAEDSGRGIGTYQGKVKADLRNKEIQGENQNYALRIQALESTISNNQTRINQLSKQLDSSLKQVQDLAVKAIEGSSNRNSFEAMKEVALEQAKNQPKGK